MASYTTSLRLVQPATGEYSGTWGTQVNNGLTALVDTSVAGTATITMTAADYTLSTANGATDEARAAILNVTGTPGAARNIIVPAVSKLYVVFNNTTGGFAQTVKTSAGTGISVPNGATAYLRCDGTNVVAAVNYLGSLTLGAALPAASGGTGLTSPGTAGNVLTSDGTNWISSAASGNVAGPGSSVSGNIATFNGVTGKIIQDGGKALPAGSVVGTTDTQTLTNKRFEPRVNSQATTTSPWAWSSDSYDEQAFTALANALTINADAGTPVDGLRTIFRFKDNGTARALTWTTGTSKSFRAVGVTLPTTTVISKTIYVGCIYNAADARWDAIAVATEA